MKKDLLNKDDAGLKDVLLEKREAMRSFRFKISGAKSRNVKELRNLRRDVARILTLLQERQKSV
jgi:ribosomal protein L29